ncbi:histidinol-phosphate transaminase [Spongiibacter sp. KMU-158]|uniref:Histidinol-phosphate aminotransferase n=1 Tax=Spongiibacter pelagi TaxID=2760804 RepID=A0A927GWQ5_9GAMM|nr:histidinol-phosphate transaminase [Spongiibacter pelagi]MBD2859715.1 histidinol-phosphate transaminase [Spongiibacter pelagi]
MSRFWNPLIKKLVPYVPGEQPKIQDLVKLNTNENPFPPSPKVLAAISAATGEGLRLYPDPDASALKATIANYYNLTPDCVFVGNGSDEVLAHTFQALFNPERPLLFPDITYSFYPVYCGLYRQAFETVPLDEQFKIRVEKYDGLNGGIIFPNPNAPTGCLLSLDEIERLLKVNTETVVVVDEAYIDFGGESAAKLIDRYDNLLVVQTLSKSRSLAGMRVGLALGHPELIEALERVKNSFNSYPLDKLAQAGAVAAFEDDGYFQQCRDDVIREREALVDRLSAMGFEVLPSAANFVFCRHAERDAGELAAALRERKVIVRHFMSERIAQFLRITIGTSQQNSKLLEALEAILGSK